MAGLAIGIDGIFLETHPNPSQALSDGPNMIPLDEINSLLQRMADIGSKKQGS
ncbi:MAG: hypothetical protein ACK4OO_04980 [bacterium]